jgi:hypothetical protein
MQERLDVGRPDRADGGHVVDDAGLGKIEGEADRRPGRRPIDATRGEQREFGIPDLELDQGSTAHV